MDVLQKRNVNFKWIRLLPVNIYQVYCLHLLSLAYECWRHSAGTLESKLLKLHQVSLNIKLYTVEGCFFKFLCCVLIFCNMLDSSVKGRNENTADVLVSFYSPLSILFSLQLFSDDDSAPHPEGRTKGHTKDTWKTCLQKIISRVFFTLSHHFQKLFRRKHSHEIQSEYKSCHLTQ